MSIDDKHLGQAPVSKITLTELKAWHQTTGVTVPKQLSPQFDSAYTFEKHETVGYE